MTLHQLRILMAVAQSSTLTRASKQLGLAQPSLSQQLAKLEESVGTRLFDRSHNRMVLTDAGQVLVRHAQAVLKEIDEAEARMIAGLSDYGSRSSDSAPRIGRRHQGRWSTKAPSADAMGICANYK